MGVQSAEDETSGRPASARPLSGSDVDASAQRPEAAGAIDEPPHPSIRDSGHIIWSATADGMSGSEPDWGQFTGQSAAQAAGWGWLDAIHSDDRERARRAWSRAVEARDTYEIHLRIRRSDGVYRTFLMRGVPRTGQDGGVREWVGFCLDITGRAQMERERAHMLQREQTALAETAMQASHLNAIFDAIADGVFVYDAGGRLLRANPAGRALLSFDAHPAHQPASAWELGHDLHVRDRHGVPIPREQWPPARVLRGEMLTGASAMDLRVRALDGQDKDVNVAGMPLRDAAGHVAGGVTVMRDVTAQRGLEQRTHDALDALLAMARTLVSVPDEAIEYMEREAGATSASWAVARRLAELTRDVLGCRRIGLTTIEPESGVQHPLAVVGLSPEQEREWWDSVEGTRVDNPEANADPDLAARFFSGKALVLDMRQPPFRDQSNPYGITTFLVAPMRMGTSVVGILSLDYGGEAHDFTPEEIALSEAVAQLAAFTIERERLLREREEARANELALRQANRRMDEFLGIAGHELRTPLTSIRGSLQVMRRRIGGLAERQDVTADDAIMYLRMLPGLLDRATAQTGVLNRLIDDLLDVSRIQAGRLRIDTAPRDLVALVRQAVERQRDLAPARAIRVEAPSSKVWVSVDADRVEQVVDNYLSNALKFSTGAQPVTVGVATEGEGAEARVRVWVRDDGPGLAATEQERVWDRFYQADGTPYRHGSSVGLGLGLYISRMIVEQHRGRVGVESSVGQGATFWFTLPLTTPPHASSDPR